MIERHHIPAYPFDVVKGHEVTRISEVWNSRTREYDWVIVHAERCAGCLAWVIQPSP